MRVYQNYDTSGNPLSYYNGTRWAFTWENGRSLATANDGTTNISYAYDANGLRTSKVVNGVTHNYLYASGQLMRETYGNNVFDFFYDANGYPYALKYNGTTYYYITNLQGDVMYLIDANENTVASYEYDPYGNIVSATGTLAEINPLRYRGYYYDAELGMYYLQSRYYDPHIGRFISADAYASTGQGVIGFNMFAYCNNNPANGLDYAGDDAIWLQDITAVGGLGHTGLLLQDARGKWWHFYWGNNRNGSSGKSGTGNILMAYQGGTSLASINKFYKEHYGSEYEASIYFKGDFSNSVEYANTVDKYYYNFVFNNCMQVSTDVLRRGKFSQSNLEYKAFLLRVRHTAAPNSVYYRMDRFSTVVKTWHNSKWYQKLYLLSPAKAVYVL